MRCLTIKLGKTSASSRNEASGIPHAPGAFPKPVWDCPTSEESYFAIALDVEILGVKNAQGITQVMGEGDAKETHSLKHSCSPALGSSRLCGLGASQEATDQSLHGPR